MTFIPSKLGIPRSTGTYPVKWENPGWGLTGVYDYWLWGDDYSEEGPLDVTISNASTSGCTINFTNPSTITTDSSTIFRLYPKGLTTAQLEDTMPVYLHSQAPGYYPANSSITVPNTGGTYTVEYILGRADIIKWTCDVVNATALVSVEVLEWDSCSIKFKITVNANTQWNTNLTGTIQLGAYYETNKFISYSYGFTIEKSGVPEDLKLIVNPSSGTYGAGPGVTDRFMCTLTSTEEEITELSVTCPGASNINVDEVNKYFVITFPDNATTSIKNYAALVTAITSGGYTLNATVPITKLATSLSLKSSVSIGYTAGRYKIDGTGSDNLDDVVFAIPADAQTWLSKMELVIERGTPGGMNIVSINFDATENTGNASRKATVGVTVVKNGSSVINTSFNIVQEVKADISPIWKDYIWEEETLNDFIEYHLDYAGDTIYAGKAYKYPDTTGVQFLLNDVSEDFLDNGIIFPSFGKTEIIPNYLKTFTLITSSGSEKPVTFFNDWSYKDTDLTKPYFLSDPIDTLVDSRQYVLCSWIFPTGEGVLNRRYTTPEGVATTVDITLRQGINGYTYAEPLGNLLLECKSKYEIGFVESGSFTTTINYQIDTTNKNYVLYYTNAYGGWDSLLVQGNVKQTDQIESQTYVRKVLNTTSQFSKNKYLNTIVPEWTLYTNYLTDTQASKMHHLLESTMVYLHNLEDNKIIPVIITNNSCEYKTYSNQGKNMFYYTIEVQSSQDKYRK